MDLTALLGFVFFGTLIGAYGTLIGVGGGFIIVPVLLLFLGWDHEQAVGTSLMVVAANALSGTLAYWRQGRIDLQTGWQFALATLPGAVLGSYTVQYISGRIFDVVFGVFMAAVSLYMIWRPERTAGERLQPERPASIAGWGWTVRCLVDASGKEYHYGFSRMWGLILSFGVGFLSSILGIGGGIVHVPALITLFSFPPHIATATSVFILSFSAATGTATHFTLGNVVLDAGIATALGAMAGAQAGSAFARRLHGRWLVRALSLALAAVGIRLVIG